MTKTADDPTPTLTKIWVTRYALTAGIFTVEATIDAAQKMAKFKRKPENFHEYMFGKDWHRTEEAALERAEQMKAKKLASLKKQLKAVEALTFKAAE